MWHTRYILGVGWFANGLGDFAIWPKAFWLGENVWDVHQILSHFWSMNFTKNFPKDNATTFKRYSSQFGRNLSRQPLNSQHEHASNHMFKSRTASLYIRPPHKHWKCIEIPIEKIALSDPYALPVRTAYCHIQPKSNQTFLLLVAVFCISFHLLRLVENLRSHVWSSSLARGSLWLVAGPGAKWSQVRSLGAFGHHSKKKIKTPSIVLQTQLKKDDGFDAKSSLCSAKAGVCIWSHQ